MTVSVQFALCESGGLIQCGFASEDGKNDARLPGDRNLTLQFVDSPQGFAHAGLPCSQYSYKVHTPGVTLSPGAEPVHVQCESDYSLAMLGGCVTNVVGPKSVGCLFNGQLHLAGSLAPSAPFKLWSAGNGLVQSSESLAQSGKIPLDNAQGGARAEYPICWTTCVATLMKDETIIKTEDDVSAWPVGAQVVITCHSEAWQANGSFMNYADCKYGSPGDHAPSCSEPVINFAVEGEAEPVPTQSSFGVEVKTIRAVTSSQITVTKLIYDHSRTGIATFDASDKKSKVAVNAPVHVGLLTRNIRICGRDPANIQQAPAIFQAAISHATPMLSSSEGEGVDPLMHLMPMGRMNRPARMPKSLATLSSTEEMPFPRPSDWKGQGGSVTCDFFAKQTVNSDALYFATEKSPKMAIGPFLHGSDGVPQASCGDKGPQAKGSSLLGDPGKEGLVYILGGTLKFQYGCGAVLDGVELYRMGIPANTGSLGQYSIHFHCAGWGPQFGSFAAEGASRRLRVANSVNWRSFSRWCVLHGTNFADISNNVFCICMGNGVFTEDGTEHHNNVEHNLMILNIQTGLTQIANRNKLDQNPGGVVGNFGPDGFSSASIWMTNTFNYVFRNVLCCNPTYGVGIWAIALNPRSKAAPATHCVGDQDLGLPGMIGNSLTSYNTTNNTQVFQELWHPPDMSRHFTLFEGGPEAIGNIKSLQRSGGAHQGTLQSSPYLAENTAYNMGQFYIESSRDTAPWASDLFRQNFDPTRQFIPYNGTVSGSFMANNAGGLYSEAAASTAQADLQGIYTARVISQNICYSMHGVFSEAFGGFVWTQSGNSVLLGNCILGGDYWSNSSSVKSSTASRLAMGNYAAVHIDVVTNVSISGSSTSAGGCEGILVSGPKTMLGLTTCTGSRFAQPPVVGTNPGPVYCEATDDDPPPSWVAFADGVSLETVRGMLEQWFGSSYSYSAGKIPPPPITGVLSETLSCCQREGGAPWCSSPSPQDLSYVFVIAENPGASTKIGLDSSNRMKEMPWDASKPSQGKGKSCMTCKEARADERFKEIYPILNVPYVWDRWSKMCSYVDVLPYPAASALSSQDAVPRVAPSKEAPTSAPTPVPSKPAKTPSYRSSPGFR